ncbi:unnamed protein product [Vicia faba]|uniref:DNA-directed RNA polymerase n=1 Tax=Vicia faba TaxID=3906 RepID=A0AAV1A6H2_VICFA|nr:unnamed protein product [Vicia faba]
MLSLSPSRDEYYMVATRNFLAQNRGIQEDQIVPARYRQEFLTIAWKQVQKGKCVKKGQILADGAATVGGELTLGIKVLVAYMPWEGYNFEDDVLISERLVYEDIYTSLHIRKYEIQTHVTSHGPERITYKIPHLEAHLLRNLDKNGIVILVSWVETGDILVGKLMPQIAK